MTIKLSAKKRKGENVDKLRGEGMIPVILYGSKRENLPLSVDEKEFHKLYEEAGESQLIALEIEKGKESPPVLIYDIQRDPLKGTIIHADLYEPNLKEKVEAEIPLAFVGESLAVKEMEGTLIKNISSLEVAALPQDLPSEIEVNIEELETFDDVISVKDLIVPANVEIIQDSERVVAMVSRPTDVEEELEKPITEEEEAEVIGEEEEGEEEEAEEGEEEAETEEKESAPKKEEVKNKEDQK